MKKICSIGGAGHVVDEVLTYSVRLGSSLDDAEWVEVSELFSSSYGFYSEKDPSGRAGRRIRLSSSYYQRAYASEAYQIAFCRAGQRLVAEAVFRVCSTSRGRAAFVVQLVVDERFRRRGIASTLLHAIWGFSDFCCWGIVTSNAFTVESLEAATFRRVNARIMSDNRAFIRDEVLSGIGFLESAHWAVSDSESVVDTGFYTDRSSRPDTMDEVSARLGALPEGAEWLAIVFREQPLDNFKTYRMVDLDDPVEVTRKIFSLPPSRSMETTGEFFNPNFILLDDKRHVACRKEQFSAASGLPGEYLLCDRRFTVDEIRSWAEECGLAVTESRFVRAGFDAEFDASTGKEILLITKKSLNVPHAFNA